MRLFEIDAGTKTDIMNQDSLEQVFARVATECSEIIEIYKKASNMLYRGISEGNPVAFVATPHTSRTVRNSFSFAQEIYDTVMAKHGVKALRSNSIFTTSSYSRAAYYGTPYAVFPVNGFDYSWTRNVRDVILGNEVLDDQKFDPYQKMYLNCLRDNPEVVAAETLTSFTFKWVLMKKGIDAANTILAKLGVKPEHFIHSLNDIIDDSKILEMYKPMTTDIQLAIQINNEVLISSKYYALEVSTLGSGIVRYLGITDVKTNS